MEKHHIVIIVGILIVIGIWYMSKQATSLGSSITASPGVAPDTSTSTSNLFDMTLH